MFQTPFDRLRVLLRREVAGRGYVSERASNYEFDEDNAAFAEILVSRPDGDTDPWIAVVSAYPGPMRSFVVQIWRRYAPEVWLVDVERRQIEQVAEGAPVRIVGLGEVLLTATSPTLAIVVSEVFR